MAGNAPLGTRIQATEAIVPKATPKAPDHSQVTNAGTAVEAFPAGINGGVIVNFGTATLIVNQVTNAGTVGGGADIPVPPNGGTYQALPGSTLPLSVNCTVGSYAFAGEYW